MSEISKAYEPQSVEDKWYQFWLDGKFFVANEKSAKPAYSIVIPPPNVTGVLTLGHVLNNTIQDILARKARMDGKEVLWLPGTDHAGIATQTVVERALKKEGKIKHRDDLGREKFLEEVWKWKNEKGGIIIQQLKKLGASCDWTRERFTMDPKYSRCVQRVFVDLYKKGLIYRGKRMVNWCPASLTALSDEEVVMKEQKGFLYYFKVEVAEAPGTFLTIATTRPETIPGDTAVAVNPKDPRYAHLIGKHIVRPLPVELPREQKLIPIIGDEHVDFEFGTGVLKVTPAHDKADFEIGLRHKLAQIEVIDAAGRMTSLAGKILQGLDRFQARNVAAQLLVEMGVLEKEEPYTNNVGYSERADVPIEPRLSEQWFLKYPSVEKARDCVEQHGSATVPVADSGVAPESSSRAGIPFGGTPNGADGTSALPKMQFHPQRWAKVYDHWMGGLQDWCVSRQLWWGHRIPVWYQKNDSPALQLELRVVSLDANLITGRSIREIRKSAWKWAQEHAIIGNTFHNQNTGFEIFVARSSLEHAFSNLGVVNVKLVSVLPDLMREAVLISTEPHEPYSPEIKCVHVFYAALNTETGLYRVKFTVKEFQDQRKLYDHQSVQITKNGPDGNKSPEAHLKGKLAHWPASGPTNVTLADLIADVNTDKAAIRCQIESPGENWTQDPDVLDTWFSSWLWPFATMGWPEHTDTLKKFYPTTDLVTGPDIIFFWVARMIMAGYEFMGELPFQNVYFTGIIRDKQGRKMSKSLGNSPDPLDLIAKFGADALRFGVMRAAPLGQDILFDEQNVELGRNFCNKLWNACRFRQMQGGEVQGEINPTLLSSDDKWILLKLDAAIREVTIALNEYKFSDATATLYRFFWSEYCDWYVEASKAVFFGTDAARTANTLAVIDFVLSHVLRLFHPFLPFITEELWHGMGYATDMPDNQGGKTIMFAPWPKPLDEELKKHFGLDERGEKQIEARNELVGQGRNLRRLGNIASNKKVKFIFKPIGNFEPNEVEVLKLLLNAETLEVNANYQPANGTPAARTELGELFLPLEGLIDVEAEKIRLKKEIKKYETEIEKVQSKLNNPDFIKKVPPQVLEEHKQRLVEWQNKLAHAKIALAAIG